MNLLILIGLIIMFLGGIGLLFFMLHFNRNKEKKQQRKISANELINVKDIRDRFLYTLDGQIITYLKIHPVSIDLLSESEKAGMAKNLTGELKSEQLPFRFLAVSRPIDISPLLNEYTEMMANTRDRVQKSLLRNEIVVLSNYALSGEVVERQFYIILWQKFEEDAEREISNRQNDLAAKFEGAGLQCEIVRDEEIVRLCNLVNNPAYIHIEESSNIEAAMPLLMNY